MKRMLLVAVLATAVITGLTTTGEASRHAARKSGATVHVAASAKCDPSHCTGPCPHGGAAPAKAASSTAASAAVQGSAACPASDPSQCPPSCRPASSAAASTVASR